MKFDTPLRRGRLMLRYKRFLADIALDGGETITATCPNTGSMLGLTAPGSTVWVSENDSPTRKYRHTWEMVEHDLGAGPTIVGINTGHPNKLVTEAIKAAALAELTGYDALRREVRYGASSRIDILLEDETKGLCFVEIKNVHLMRVPGLAEFPDLVTERGAKHLDELTAMVGEGHRAVMLFLIQRGDAEAMKIARDIDPAYGAAFDRARAAGVEMLAYRCRLSDGEIGIEQPVPVAG